MGERRRAYLDQVGSGGGYRMYLLPVDGAEVQQNCDTADGGKADITKLQESILIRWRDSA